jgi:putative sigma-54 modulation protein
MRPMSPEDAAIQLEAVGHSFYVFRNMESGEVNVLYARHDGDYGLIEPSN